MSVRFRRAPGCALVTLACLACTPATPERAAPNDNRVAAGTLTRDTLRIRLVARMARWYPEADSGPFVDVAAFAEEGKAAQIPGPLLRVPAGTVISATVRNDLPDSTLKLFGLVTRPAAGVDSVVVPRGASRTITFVAGEPGTYAYYGFAGSVDWNVRERETLSGALVVDSAGARTDDRVFVLNIWGEPLDSTTYSNALAINGRSWPFTERIAATIGDTLRWRVVNVSVRPHPMHLHGFYYHVTARGSIARDTIYDAARRRLVVTETMGAASTMAMSFVAEREGNWLFHCHIGFHALPMARLNPSRDHADHTAEDAGRHMAGLILGISVKPPPGYVAPGRGTPRTLRMLVHEGPRRGRADRARGYVLQQGAALPAADSLTIPGPLLVLTRGEPTDITVVNRLSEPTAVHWHGLELESYSDGVPGWSGDDSRMAPMIAPADSFTARLTQPRAGTFIYHTHLNDLKQLSSGLYGPIVVLEPGDRFDPATDHVYTVGWDGETEPPRILVNGDSLPRPTTLGANRTHRMRFVNIGAAGSVRITLRRDTTVAEWRAIAKDGADLPPSQAVMQPAQFVLDVGETADFELAAPARGYWSLSTEISPRIAGVVQRFTVR